MTPHDIALAACDARLFPDTWCARLYQRARVEQWDVERDVDWASFGLPALPRSIRQAMASIYGQVYYGEVIALNMTARAIDLAPDLWVRLFGATQMMDEARHVDFFSRLLAGLGGMGDVTMPLRTLAEEFRELRSTDEILLGTQVILEGYAQCLFLEGASLARSTVSKRIRLPGGADPTKLLSVVSDYVGRDESRHVAFGVLYLRNRWATLSLPARSALQTCGYHWAGLLDSAVAAAAPDMERLGVDSAALVSRIRSAHRVHFKRIGFDT